MLATTTRHANETARSAYLAARAAGRGRSLSHCALVAVRKALSLGAIVHAPEPHFGGVITIGAHSGTFAVLGHGSPIDPDITGMTAIEAARYFIDLVGKRNAFEGAINALRRARS